MPCSGDDALGIGVSNPSQRIKLTLKRRFLGNVVTHLDIDTAVTPDGDKVYFLLVENAHVDFPSAAHKLDCHHILVNMAKIELFRTKRGVAKRVVES